MQSLRDDPRFAFDFLMDHTAVDWMADARFELVYQLYSTRRQAFLLVATLVHRENPLVPTVSDLAHRRMAGARGLRPVGIPYDDHPDLRRLFLEDDWTGYPLRKDYKHASAAAVTARRTPR